MNNDLKYGQSQTYKYNLDTDKLNWLIDKTNRSKAQTLFLYELVDGSFEKLQQLETQIKNCFICFCPGTIEQMNEIMLMQPRSDFFHLD